MCSTVGNLRKTLKICRIAWSTKKYIANIQTGISIYIHVLMHIFQHTNWSRLIEKNVARVIEMTNLFKPCWLKCSKFGWILKHIHQTCEHTTVVPFSDHHQRAVCQPQGVLNRCLKWRKQWWMLQNSRIIPWYLYFQMGLKVGIHRFRFNCWYGSR